MRNITVAVPDDVYREARIRAAQQGTSVSGLVSDYLRSLSTHELDFVRLMDEQKRVQRTIRRFSASNRLDRERVHERALR